MGWDTWPGCAWPWILATATAQKPFTWGEDDAFFLPVKCFSLYLKCDMVQWRSFDKVEMRLGDVSEVVFPEGRQPLHISAYWWLLPTGWGHG